jgi:hypothetical protein
MKYFPPTKDRSSKNSDAGYAKPTSNRDILNERIKIAGDIMAMRESGKPIDDVLDAFGLTSGQEGNPNTGYAGLSSTELSGFINRVYGGQYDEKPPSKFQQLESERKQAEQENRMEYLTDDMQSRARSTAEGAFDNRKVPNQSRIPSPKPIAKPKPIKMPDKIERRPSLRDRM